MPHRGSTRSNQPSSARMFLSAGTSEMEEQQIKYENRDKQQTYAKPRAILPATKLVKNHSRRNTDPIPDSKNVMTASSSTSSSKSWGSMVDFSFLFFPKKNSKTIHSHHHQTSPNDHPYLDSMDLSSDSISPSGTSATFALDEDYDSSNSSDSSSRLKYDKHIELKDLYLNNIATTTSNHNDPNSVDSDKSSNAIYSNKNGAPAAKMDTTNSIAAQWISMGEAEDYQQQQQQQQQYSRYNPYFSEGGIEVTTTEEPFWTDRRYSYSYGSSGSEDHSSSLYGLMTDDETYNCEGNQYDIAKEMAAPRDSNIAQNFLGGTQIRGSNQWSITSQQHSEQQQLFRDYSSSANQHQQHQNQHCCSAYEQYTTATQSNGYGQYNNNNKPSNTSSSSSQQHQSSTSTSTGSQSISRQEHSSSNANMNRDKEDKDVTSSSDDDLDDNESDSDLEDSEEEEKLRQEAALWKTAVDPKSGRTYYYNTKTLETQWRKPLCCASPSERRAARKKEKQTLAFFASMEQNILKSMQQQQQQQQSHHRSHGPLHRSMFEKTPSQREQQSNLLQQQQLEQEEVDEKNDKISQSRRDFEPTSTTSLQQHPFKLVRTISSMEDSVLAALVQRVPSFRHSICTTTANANHYNNNSAVRFGIGNTFTTFTRRQQQQNNLSGDSDVEEIEDSVINNKNQEEDDGSFTRRVPEREDSLSFGAVMGATQSSQRGFNSSNNNSFTMSSMMRTNSLYQSKFNNFDYIPEGENEDNSESCSNHMESINTVDTSPARSLVRQTGFMNLNKAELVSLLESPDENINSNNTNAATNESETKPHFSFRDSLRRMTGTMSLQLQQDEDDKKRKELITREDSLNLFEATGGTRQVTRDPSVTAFKESEQQLWNSFLSESAMRGLSIDEGEAMLELASITDRMGEIHSDSSSDHSDVDDEMKISVENVEPQLNSNASANSPSDSNQLHSSDSHGWSSIPELFADKLHHKDASTATSRPSMIRPTSLRNTASRVVLETVTSKVGSTEKPAMTRRNTCGTLYVGSTLSAPDKDATIKCVCAVYRAHIVQSTLERAEMGVDAERYRVFDDRFRKDLGNDNKDMSTSTVSCLPSLDDVTVFYRDVFTRAQMESDCIIISLIYVERLIKVTEGMLRPSINNWRSILFSCMVMASKVWDDLSMWNADFSHTCPAGVQFSLSRINELEIAVLSSLHYKVKVPASEYAKYYFLLRSMLIKSGLGSDDLKSMNPLDVEGAKNLQHISSQYQSSVDLLSDRQKAAMGRSKTTGTGGRHGIGSNNQSSMLMMDRSTHSNSSDSNSPHTSPSDSGNKQQRSKVTLEHLVQL